MAASAANHGSQISRVSIAAASSRANTPATFQAIPPMLAPQMDDRVARDQRHARGQR